MQSLISRTTFTLATVLTGCATPASRPSPHNDCQQIVDENRQLREALTKAAKTRNKSSYIQFLGQIT